MAMLRFTKNQPETPKTDKVQGKITLRPSTTRASSSKYKTFNMNSPAHSNSKNSKPSLFLNSSLKPKKTASTDQTVQPKIKVNPLMNLGKSIHNPSLSTKVDAQISNTNASIHNASVSTSSAQIKTINFITRPLSSKEVSLAKNNNSASSKSLERSQSSNNTSRNEKTLWETIELPATPGTILKLFKDKLTEYEQGEILKYTNIYYIGLNSKKVKPNPKSHFNYGYDNEGGDYEIVMCDHIAYRYEIIDRIGKGSFGQVLKVYDHKRKNLLALKIIKSKAKFQKQAEVEIEVLKFLRKKDEKDKYNVVHIESYFTFRHHACMTFELLGNNLYEFLKLNNFQGLSFSLIRRFGVQILKALKLLEKNQIVHCDLKPENILLKNSNRSSIKIIDFGSSCFTDKQLYTYIQSRFYRAPEIILGIPYTPAIDMWSFGCILVELYIGRPIFPGENEAEQLLLMMEMLGLPSEDLLLRSTRKKLFFSSNNEPKIVANSRGKKRYPGTKNIREILRGADAEFIELVLRCFEWDPNKRITAKEALKHQWFTDENNSIIPKVSSVNKITLLRGQTTNHFIKMSMDEQIIQNPSFQIKLTARKIGKHSNSTVES
ncbi:unnamed protein product [Blepharisma stoltei]|uniref:dual-specificity kinase n=1 Tax=Blepharisma stoltei TaxID=1481888 RepID=A0AAU9JQC7_9CILI|nr:unnamed protein product [Blepharisma stoltei]